MAHTKKFRFGSRIARLIFASNLTGLAILIAGAMILNEMRSGYVLAKKHDLYLQAEIIRVFVEERATLGFPEPSLSPDKARRALRSISLPPEIRAIITVQDNTRIADSFHLSERVSVATLPALEDPSWWARTTARLSENFGGIMEKISPMGAGNVVRVQSFEDEIAAAWEGQDAVSQRFSEQGQRIISVSVPIRHVSQNLGVLTVEAGNMEALIRAERAALLPFIAVAVFVALITSWLLTIGIARPLRKLARAADRVRVGKSDALGLPKLAARSDEIGVLAGSMDAMTAALMERITSNETFAADVAHELKNPLTSIRSAVETAELVQDDPAKRALLRGVIAQDVRRLDRLITDISNASRLEAEFARTPRVPVDIDKFIKEIVHTYGPQSTTADGEPTLTYIDETYDAGLTVSGRRGPLGQVLRNLIDNALSFSPAAGSVTVYLEQGANGPQTLARLRVEDDGPGIPEDKVEQIFERFYTDREGSKAQGNNSGLGLSIVKQIVDSHHGRVYAENRESGGARFVVELPAD